MKRAWCLMAAILLASCARSDTGATPEQLLMEAQAQRYLLLCRRAVATFQARYAFEQHALPRQLDGQDCHSERLREYALLASERVKVERSVIQSESSRLSGYTIEVEGRDGKLYTYVDRGVAAAAAEQAGTLDAGTPSTDLNVTPEADRLVPEEE